MRVVGLDIGTTGCKAIVMSGEGKIEGYAFRELDIIFSGNNHAEQNPDFVWEKSKEVIREAIGNSQNHSIHAVCVSVQGDAVIPVDQCMNPLCNAILGMDYRSLSQAEECARLIGEHALFQMTGMRSHPMNSLTKILWLKENFPQIYFDAYKFMTYADFINAKLGADSAIDMTMASRTMAFDLNKKEWSQDILTAINLEEKKLSKVVESGTVIGRIDPALAEELQVPKTVLLVAGGHDQVCAAIGAGAITPGVVLDSHGTADVLAISLDEPILDEEMYSSFYPCYIHAAKSKYFTFSLNHVGGLLLKWYRDNFAAVESEEAKTEQINVYKIIESKIPNIPSKVLVLPHFNGSGTPTCDLNSRGAIIGLTLSSTRHDIAKGIMDSAAYELRLNIENFRTLGVKIEEIRCVGGASKSGMWMQLKADITGCRIVTLKEKEAACCGAALLALVGLGEINTIEEAVAKVVEPENVYEPNLTNSTAYGKIYEVYKRLYPALKEINTTLVSF